MRHKLELLITRIEVMTGQEQVFKPIIRIDIILAMEAHRQVSKSETRINTVVCI